MGDYADCITVSDPRFDIGGLAGWVERDNIVESQRQWLRKLLAPLKGRIIGLLTGNHEEAIHLKHQTNFTLNLCRDLGVPYLGYSCIIDLSFSRPSSRESHMWQLHAWHGAGAAQTDGARLMRLMSLVKENQADIYLMGHLHAKTSTESARLSSVHGKIKSKPMVATMTGSWLRAYTQGIAPSYAEMKGYKPSVIGCPVVYVSPTRGPYLGG